MKILKKRGSLSLGNIFFLSSWEHLTNQPPKTHLGLVLFLVGLPKGWSLPFTSHQRSLSLSWGFFHSQLISPAGTSSPSQLYPHVSSPPGSARVCPCLSSLHTEQLMFRLSHAMPPGSPHFCSPTALAGLLQPPPLLWFKPSW